MLTWLLATCVENIQSIPCTLLHKKVDCLCPTNWHNMLHMTYAVCHLLASKDRCERPCLSLSDWWLVSLPSVSTPSESLVLAAVAILRKWKKSNMQAVAVTCHVTQADKWTLTLAFLSFTLPRSTPLHLPRSHPVLVPAPVSPDFGLSHQSEESLAGVTGAQFAVCASVVKSMSWWLRQSWIAPQLYHPWMYGDKMSFQSLWGQRK